MSAYVCVCMRMYVRTCACVCARVINRLKHPLRIYANSLYSSTLYLRQ